MYIRNTFNFIKRPDLEVSLDGVETCFIEIARVKQKHVIIFGSLQEIINKHAPIKKVTNSKKRRLSNHGCQTAY